MTARLIAFLAGVTPLFLSAAQPNSQLSLVKAAGPAAQAAGQAAAGSQPSPAEFGRLAARLAGDRAGAPAEQEPLQEQALQMLDRVALPYLNSAAPGGAGADPSGRPSAVATLNRTLATFVTRQPPIGEGYRVLPLAANPAIYALIADFGLSGPSAVRLYAGAPGQLALVARIDRYAQKDYFDDYMELVPVSTSAPDQAAVFVTVSGRTDDLHTGVFTAWKFDGHRVVPVWSSDILQQSAYEAAADGFRITYCADADFDGSTMCKRMQRDTYAWQNEQWKQVGSTAVPASALK